METMQHIPLSESSSFAYLSSSPWFLWRPQSSQPSFGPEWYPEQCRSQFVPHPHCMRIENYVHVYRARGRMVWRSIRKQLTCSAPIRAHQRPWLLWHGTTCGSGRWGTLGHHSLASQWRGSDQRCDWCLSHPALSAWKGLGTTYDTPDIQKQHRQCMPTCATTYKDIRTYMYT